MLKRLVAWLCTTGALSQNVVDQSGNVWTLENLPLNISVPGSVPSRAHLHLYAAQVIRDPYYGLKDFSLRWMPENNWTYSALFPALDTSSSTRTWLLFNGLDTFTSIGFCGQHVAATNNQFRQYYFDVSTLLSNCCSPTLSINFRSTPNIADQIAVERGQETWRYEVEIVYGYPNQQFIRKEQSDFGWDWGPASYCQKIHCLSYTCGIRNLISLVFVNRTTYSPIKAPWLLNASLDILGAVPQGAALAYIITNSSTDETVSPGTLENTTSSNSTIPDSAVLDPSPYELRWPRGLGVQNLYNLTLSIADSSSNTLVSVNRRTGFRTIVQFLNMQTILDAQIAQGIALGNNWVFEINGHEFYAKGSTFITPDAFSPRVSVTKMQQLFNSVTAANHNMLRVWASGTYTPDFIYDNADQEGALMWSEFEFGDALHLVDQAFIKNVIEEATYNVRRANHHLSLALWTGGNTCL